MGYRELEGDAPGRVLLGAALGEAADIRRDRHVTGQVQRRSARQRDPGSVLVFQRRESRTAARIRTGP